MAKLTKRLSIKGILDLKNNQFIEFDKDVGKITHNLDNLFAEFDNLDSVTLTLAYDDVVLPD